jgi:ankyrin repeat protein
MIEGVEADGLIQAARAKDLEEARRRLAAGADVHARDDNGSTALHFAACGMPALIKLLCENGARPGAKDAKGFTPLHVAYLRKDVECVRALAAHGADIHDPIPGGESPLEEARTAGNTVMLAALGQ